MRETLGALLSCSIGLFTLAAPPKQGIQAPFQAQSVLNRAESFLGGRSRLSSIHAFEFERAQTTTVRVLFPDCYRIETRTPFGTNIVSFDGTQRWSRLAKSDGTVVPAPPVEGETQAVMHLRGRRAVAIYALTYFLRVLPTYPLRPVLHRAPACEGIEGDCIEFRPTNGADPSIFMVFSAMDGRPVALVTPISDSSGGPTAGYLRANLGSYGVVDGVRLPFEIDERQVRDSRAGPTSSALWRQRAFNLNPRYSRELFRPQR